MKALQKGHIWDYVMQQVTFEKTKILVKQVKVLGIPHTWQSFELDVSLTSSYELDMWQKQEKENTP